MKTFLIEIDEETAAEIERVAPARSRKRSDFVRNAIRKALWEVQEQNTKAAYERLPDTPEDAYLEGAAWEPSKPPRPAKRSKR